jgi:DnaJ-class molecular chaperone
MSIKKKILEIVPPGYVRHETHDFGGFECPGCHGRGFFIEYDRRGSLDIPCGRCDGSGVLKATVSVIWSPDARRENRRN